jgi:hypothetical protein
MYVLSSTPPHSCTALEHCSPLPVDILVVYASAVSSGHCVRRVPKVTSVMKKQFDAELDFVNRCHTVEGQKFTIVYIVIKRDFWPPRQCTELLNINSLKFLITNLQ